MFSKLITKSAIAIALTLTIIFSAASIATPVQAQIGAGNLTGSFSTIHRGFYIVEADSANTHRMSVRRNQVVTVRINGDDDTDLDLFVYDPYGQIVGQDLSRDDNETVTFRARMSGTYTIRVSNLGDVWNEYSLAF
jgi:hypothetical protein